MRALHRCRGPAAGDVGISGKKGGGFVRSGAPRPAPPRVGFALRNGVPTGVMLRGQEPPNAGLQVVLKSGMSRTTNGRRTECMTT